VSLSRNNHNEGMREVEKVGFVNQVGLKGVKMVRSAVNQGIRHSYSIYYPINGAIDKHVLA